MYSRVPMGWPVAINFLITVNKSSDTKGKNQRIIKLDLLKIILSPERIPQE